MTSTIFATFIDATQAERAAGALLDHGLSPVDLTLLAHQEYQQERSASLAAAQAKEEKREENEIQAHETTGTSVGFPGADSTGRSTGEPQGSWSEPGSKIAYGAEMAGGIESTDAATHYPGGDAAFGETAAPNYQVPTPAGGNLDRVPVTAKSGVSTTTGSDVASGAIKGAAVGIGVGVLASLVAVFVPGFGLVLGSGALALAIEAAAGATGAGIIAGGVVGFLKDQGVPDGATVIYREAIDRGGAMLAVSIPPEMDRGEVEAVLAKYGAENLEMYARD